MNTKIYQIYYKESQKAHLEKQFVPFNNEGKTYPLNFEYAVFFDLYKKEDWEKTNLLGSVSWKFSQKTGLTDVSLLNYISENPNMDVYFVNPFPELTLYNSVWEQGDAYHPKLTEVTAALLRECGYSENVLKNETPPNLMAYCNYWIANKKFWDAYINYLTPIWHHILNKDTSVTRLLMEPADPNIDAPYLPFIFERLFSTFISENDFKISSIPICSKKNNPLLWPVRSRIAKINKLKTHQEISLLDKILISSFYKLRRFCNYELPLLIKNMKK